MKVRRESGKEMSLNRRVSYVLAFACAVFQAAAYEIRMPEKKDGTQMLAGEELIQHLDCKAQEVPYTFVFAKPDGVPEPNEFESCYLVKDGTVWFSVPKGCPSFACIAAGGGSSECVAARFFAPDGREEWSVDDVSQGDLHVTELNPQSGLWQRTWTVTTWT